MSTTSSVSTEKYQHLSAQQLERVDALRIARNVLSATQGFAKVSAPDPIDLVNVARYVTSGTDPYEATREAAQEKVAREVA